MSSRGAEIGRDERGFEIVERIGVDLFIESYNLVDAFAEILARARDRVLHPLEKALLLLFFLIEAAE